IKATNSPTPAFAWTRYIHPMLSNTPPTGCVYDFPTSSEGRLPTIVDAQKKRQYTPFKIETMTDFKRRSLSWKQYTTPPELILDGCCCCIPPGPAPNSPRLQGCQGAGSRNGKKRLVSAPLDDEQVLHGLSRAPHHRPPRLDSQVVDRLLEIRDDPPE